MSVSSINGNNSALFNSFAIGGASNSAPVDADGDHDGSRVTPRNGFNGGGRFAAAIGKALAQFGISPDSVDSTGSASASADSTTVQNSTSGGTNASNNTDPKQALANFVQNLFAVLQSQNNSQSGTGSDGSAANSTQGSRPHHGGLSKLEGDLQRIIQQLSTSATSSTDTTDTSTTSTSTTDLSNTNLDALQQSFNQLLAADGKSGSGTSLEDFLQSFAQNLQGATATGNVVSAKV